MTGAGSYVAGSTVPVTATANSGYQFVNWSGPVADPNATSTTVTVNGPTTVTANFVHLYTMTITVTPAGTGTVTGAGTYTAGSVVTLAATPAPGYRFKSWSGGASGTANSVQVTMTANKSVTATFVQQVTLTVTTTGNGTATGTGTYDLGQRVSVVATPAAGWKFLNWTGPVASPTSASTSVTLAGDTTVTANFTPITYTVTATVTPTGSGTVNGTGAYNSGDTATLTAVPALGYRFKSWSGALTGSTNPASLTVNGNKSETATFVRIYNLTVLANPTAGGSVTGSGTYDTGTKPTITATADPGYHFVNWTGPVASPTSATTTVTMSADTTVTANFSQ